MKSVNHHNTGDMGHQKKASKAQKSNKTQKSSSSSSNNNKQNNSSSSSAALHEDEKDSSASNRYKNYAGISGRSVKCYWEQYNSNQQDMCQEEVYMRVAEDVTYKLWELGNALKVYSRHTGGRVTTDLVNVVLKDMNVPPVLGANSSNWDTIDFGADGDQVGDDGTSACYFNSDRVVDLREEYMKEYQMLQPGPTSVTSSWCVEDEVSEDLLDLFDKLCDAIFLGDEETFVAALEVADSHPFVCGIISLLLNKCTEMLAFDYKKGTLERTMKFLVALTGNSYLDQNHVDLELYYLSQLMISLLLGADNDKYFESLPKLTNGAECTAIGGVHSEPPDEEVPDAFCRQLVAGELMDYTEAQAGVQGVVIKTEPVEAVDERVKAEELDGIELHADKEKLDATLFNGFENSTTSQEATTVLTALPNAGEHELKHEYEALFIMDNGEFGMKKLEEFQIKAEPTVTAFAVTDEESAAILAATAVPMELKQEEGDVAEPEEEEEGEGENESESGATVEGEPEAEEEEEEMCVITTKMCDTEDVALVCQCMGRLAGFWSYMYRECSYLLLRRIDQFFLSGVILLKCEYEWLVRAIQAVFALGEVPFREFSAHVDKLHVTITPDWVTVQLNCCGIFLRDQQDGELYDLLYELCGDAILPFMLYRFMILKHLATATVRSRVVKYRIVSKVVPKLLEAAAGAGQRGRRTRGLDSEKEDSLDSWFEDRGMVRHNKMGAGKAPRIGFKFAGCRPMPVKKQQQQQQEREKEAQEERSKGIRTTTTDRSRVIVARRKLLRPLTNLQNVVPAVYDLSSFHF